MVVVSTYCHLSGSHDLQRCWKRKKSLVRAVVVVSTDGNFTCSRVVYRFRKKEGVLPVLW